MSCKLDDASPDWKAYGLGEMDAHARQEAETHVAACSDCQDELARLRVTLDAMATLREEELPRRIAFVSDKVFEPRWYQKMFLRPSFAAAALIAAAILVHAFVRPAVLPSATAQVDTTAIEARVTAQVTERLQSEMAAAVNTAVTQAVAETVKRDDQRTVMLLAATEKRYSDAADFLNRQVTRIYALNTGAGVR